MKSCLKLSLMALLCGMFLCSSTVLMAGTPDLTLISWTVSPNNVTVGSTVTVSGTIKNIGNGTANGGHVIRYYFSTDAVLSSNDVLLGGNHISNSMNPGTTKYVSKSVTTPSGIATNRYYCILFVVDHTNVVAEGSGENNNLKSREIYIRPCYVPAKPGTISGPGSFCPDENGYYSVSAVPNATSYIWTLPSGLSGNSTSNGISIYGNPGTYTICVQATSSCGTSAQRCKTITVLRFNQCNFDPCDPWRPSCGPMYPKMANEDGPTIQAAETDGGQAIADNDLLILKGKGEPEITDDLQLYPNPANTTVTIQTNETGQVARIINMSGAIVKEVLIAAPNMLLDIADLPKGIYLINVITENGILTEKLLKQ